MRVKFAHEDKRATCYGKRAMGHCLRREKDATIIIDNILSSCSIFLEDADDSEIARNLIPVELHELIHRDLRFYDEDVVRDISWDIANDLCSQATIILKWRSR